MGKKKYMIRLYRSHDLDLITFVERHQFNLVRGVYSSITAFSKKEQFIIQVPPKRINGQLDFKKIYAKMLTLDTEKDKKAIAILDKVKDGCKNNFLKNVLRLYLSYPMSESFLEDEADMPYFDAMFEMFRENKQVVNAGKLIKKTKSVKKKAKETKKSEIISDLHKTKTYDETLKDMTEDTINEAEADEITDLFSSFIEE